MTANPRPRCDKMTTAHVELHQNYTLMQKGSHDNKGKDRILLKYYSSKRMLEEASDKATILVA